MKQAAMYVRVSTSQQKEEETIESQKEALLIFAKTRGFEIPPKLIFEDNGFSGSSLARPALDKLRDYASEGIIDHVFVLSPDRLSRKYAYQALLLEEFKKSNVSLIFRNSPNQKTPEETLLVQMQGMFAEYERAQITERTRRGKKHKARNGVVSSLTKASYGYRYIKDPIGSQTYFEVNDKESSVIKVIFDLYTKERMSMGEIKAYLNKHKIFSPTGNETWSTSTISGMLRNTSYMGIAYYGKKETCEPTSQRLPSRQVRIKQRTTAKRAHRNRERGEWIGIPVPAIVDNDIFNLAQELLKKNIKLSKRNTKEGSLLQGLISCKECGYSLKHGVSGRKEKGYHYYSCREKTCKNPSIKVKDLDEAIWNALVSTLESPVLIRNEVSRRLSELRNEPQELRRKQIAKKIAGLELESNRLLDAYQASHIEIDDLKIRMEDVKKRMNNAKREAIEADAGLSKEQLLELTEAIECFSKHLKTNQQGLTLEEKRKIIRMLVKEIRVGKESVEIDHIIPIPENPESHEIARLCTARHYGL